MALPIQQWSIAQIDPAEEPARPVRVVGADEQFDLAVHFFSQQDYNRAITEFERFCFYFPNDERYFLARYKIGAGHLQLRAYPLALQSFSEVTDSAPPTRLFYMAAFSISECLLRLGETDRATIHLLNLAATADTPEMADEANYRLGWLHLESHQTDKASLYFARISQRSRDKFNVSGAEQALEELNQLNRKSPELAGLLGVVPGAGYLYAERYQDALISLVINGLLFWAAYESFDHDLPALGCLTGLMGAGFYTGSIYGSVSSVHKYNRKAYDSVVNRYRPNFTVGIGIDPNKKRYLAGILIRF